MSLLDWARQRLGSHTIGYLPLSDNGLDQTEKADGPDSSEFDDEVCDLKDVPGRLRWGIGLRRHLGKITVLLPSFLHPADPNTQPRELHRTAWLDGLRGIAAFFVVWHHMSLLWFSWDLHNGWTGPGDPLVRLPIVRLAISGLPNVMTFFVVSGYALSYKPLGLLRRDRLPETYRALASSAFRRHPRLFMPAAILCAPFVLVAYAGLYGSGERMPDAAVATLDPPRLDTLWAQFVHYGGAVSRLCDPFAGDAANWVYNDALWTLPLEFRGSLVVFGLLLALSRARRGGVRILVTAAVALYCICAVHWAEFLFVGGMLAADLQFCLANSERASAEEEDHGNMRCQQYGSRSSEHGAQRKAGRGMIRITISLISFFSALYLLGMPKLQRGGAETPGFRVLASLIPENYRAAGASDYFWLSLAAVWVVLTIDRTPFLQAVFTCRFPQYLGRISYSLYLVHLPILHSFGFRTGKFFVGLTGSDTEIRYFSGILASAVLFWSITIWVADLGWRFVDVKVVRLASWAYNRLCEDNVPSLIDTHTRDGPNIRIME
ncbi:hypothetical protein AAE478_002539 [Parahypoxylon ruwenzoriense]